MQPECQFKEDDLKIVEQWVFGRSLNTQDYYRRYALELLRFVARPMSTISLEDLQAFASGLEQRLGKSGQRTALAAIKSLFSFAEQSGYLGKNASSGLRSPKAKDTLSDRILTEADTLLIIRLEPEPQNQLILKLAYSAGLRVSEICGLKWKNFHLSGDTGFISVFGKGGKTRSILLSQAIWKLFQDFRDSSSPKEEDAIFCIRGKPLTRFHVYAIVKAAAARVDSKASPHWLRHAHASHALDRGAPIHLVQSTLGHSSVSTTGRYLHAKPNDSSARFLPL